MMSFVFKTRKFVFKTRKFLYSKQESLYLKWWILQAGRPPVPARESVRKIFLLLLTVLLLLLVRVWCCLFCMYMPAIDRSLECWSHLGTGAASGATSADTCGTCSDSSLAHATSTSAQCLGLVSLRMEESWFPIEESWFSIEESWFPTEKWWFFKTTEHARHVVKMPVFVLQMMVFPIRNDEFILTKWWFYNKKVRGPPGAGRQRRGFPVRVKCWLSYIHAGAW